MPATRHTSSDKIRHTVLYSLAGTSKAALTVAALKSHQKQFKLPTAGNKSTLINRLFSHLQSSQADTSQGNVANFSQHTSQESGTAILPQQFLDQLSHISFNKPRTIDLQALVPCC